MPENTGPQYVAWNEPAHDILHRGSEHFIGRMGRHRWLIAQARSRRQQDGQASGIKGRGAKRIVSGETERSQGS